MEASSQQRDVVIIGGGPAGATAAALLSMHGRDVLVLEKETFPRYKLGESLIPFNYFPLKRIGMLEKLADAPFVNKHSVQFVRDTGEVSRPFYFDQHMDHPCSSTWQVERSQFDQLMLDNAREKGADVREGVRVKDLLHDDEQVAGVRTATGEEIHARIVIDASGRDSLSISRLNWRMPDRRLRKIAIWSYYQGGKRGEGRDEGATTVAYVGGKNWFWHIPLQNDIASVGLVGDKAYLFRDGRDLETVFNREVRNNAWVTEHLTGSKRVEDLQVTSDFSYRSRFCATDGLVLIGDAFAFLDPVFSSGMYFAVYSGELAGDAVHAALTANDVSAGRFEAYGAKFRSAIEAMRKLVYSFYEPDFHFGVLLKKYPELRAPLTDILIGNLDTDLSPLFEALAEFIDVPEDLPYGGSTTGEWPNSFAS